MPRHRQPERRIDTVLEQASDSESDQEMPELFGTPPDQPEKMEIDPQVDTQVNSQINSDADTSSVPSPKASTSTESLQFDITIDEEEQRKTCRAHQQSTLQKRLDMAAQEQHQRRQDANAHADKIRFDTRERNKQLLDIKTVAEVGQVIQTRTAQFKKEAKEHAELMAIVKDLRQEAGKSYDADVLKELDEFIEKN
jgi:hypothetical protein